MKHIDVAYLWMQDEVSSKWLRERRVKSEENVAALRTKPLSKAETATHRVMSAMFWDYGSIQMIVTGGRTVSSK